MADNEMVGKSPPSNPDLAHVVRQALERTPARLLVGRAGPAYRTATWLKLREDHAFARDAVFAEIDFERDFPRAWIDAFSLFAVQTTAETKSEFLLRPDRGRMLSEESRSAISERCPSGADVQIVVGDGLSATAVVRQVPAILPLLKAEVLARGWTLGRPFFVRHCRVGVMNDIGELLKPRTIVLLIGERPGLATAESLSAYLGYCPRLGHTDVDRNLISNIHAQGASPEEAAGRICQLISQMLERKTSGVEVKEQLSAEGNRRLSP
jgi:ethanolamine ammonia-lyase small subunit